MPMPPFIIPVMAGLVAAPAGWNVIASALGNLNGASGTITLGPINTTGADLIIVGAAGGGSSPPITDSQGNSWADATGSINSGATILYAWNAKTSASHTFQITGSYYNAFGLIAYSGSLKSSAPLDQLSSNSGSAASPSITPAQNNELVFVSFGVQSNNDQSTLTNGFTVRNRVVYAAGNNYGVATGDLFQATAAAISTTINQSSLAGCAIASFKHA
jgi:hypothetical protein